MNYCSNCIKWWLHLNKKYYTKSNIKVHIVPFYETTVQSTAMSYYFYLHSLHNVLIGQSQPLHDLPLVCNTTCLCSNLAFHLQKFTVKQMGLKWWLSPRDTSMLSSQKNRNVKRVYLFLFNFTRILFWKFGGETKVLHLPLQFVCTCLDREKYKTWICCLYVQYTIVGVWLVLPWNDTNTYSII